MVIAYFSSANLFNFLLSLYAYVATSIYCLLCFMKEAPAFRNLSMVFLCSVCLICYDMLIMLFQNGEQKAIAEKGGSRVSRGEEEKGSRSARMGMK